MFPKITKKDIYLLSVAAVISLIRVLNIVFSGEPFDPVMLLGFFVGSIMYWSIGLWIIVSPVVWIISKLKR